MTKNPCYTAGRKITVKGLMLHSVGCSQPSAKVFINTFNKSSYNAACVHGFIDANTGTVYQTLPWNHRGWHGGSGPNGCCNNTHIGIEMCEPSSIKYTNGGRFTCLDSAAAKADVQRTYDAAVELFAYLCKQFNLNPIADGVIISHKEGCARGIATNHGDPEHLWNGLGMGCTMDKFRQDVKSKMNGDELTMTQYEELNRRISALEAENKQLKNQLEYADTTIYDYIDKNMPDAVRPTIQKLVGKNALQGEGDGKLNLHYETCRILTILDRLGIL